MTNTDRNDDIYKVIDEIADYLATLTKEERIAWFKRNMYLEPLNFVKEIDGTLYRYLLQRRWHTPRTHSRRNGRSVPKSYGGTQSKNGIANGYTV